MFRKCYSFPLALRNNLPQPSSIYTSFCFKKETKKSCKLPLAPNSPGSATDFIWHQDFQEVLLTSSDTKISRKCCSLLWHQDLQGMLQTSSGTKISSKCYRLPLAPRSPGSATVFLWQRSQEVLQTSFGTKK